MNKYVILTYAFILVICLGCNDDDNNDDKGEVIGIITVDLDLSKPMIRTREMPAGNLVTDAIAWYLREQGKEIDAAFYNGGGLRADTMVHSGGIIPAGEITDKIIWEELLMFNNEIVIATVTGAELKEMLEKSVSFLPYPKGWFLHVSSDGYYKADTSKTAQTVSGVPYEEEIEIAGERILSIKFGGIEYHQDSIYKVVVHSWIADGGDSYVTLRKLSDDKKENTGIIDAKAVEEYIRTYTPVSPQVEGRIELLP